MSWGRMDDKFHRHPKVRALRQSKQGREALGAWTYWWSWCLDDPELTGRVPKSELSRDDMRAARLLVEVGLWDELDAFHYGFHDFHAYNPTRDQVEHKRAADRERVALKRAATRDPFASESHATNERLAPPGRVPCPYPDPDPNPSHDRDPADQAVGEVPLVGPESQVVPLIPLETSTFDLVKFTYARWLHQATTHAPSWTHKTVEQAQKLADWLDQKQGDAPKLLERMMSAFFKHRWAREHGFPLALLANNPHRFLSDLKPVRDVSQGFVAPAPASAFQATPTDAVFGPPQQQGR